MASTAKLETMRKPGIDPVLKSFIDECVVPLLVREYLSQMGADNSLASIAGPALHSPAIASASASEGER